MTFWRAPRPDAAWRQRKALHEDGIESVARLLHRRHDARVRGAQPRDVEEPTDERMQAFWERIAIAAAKAVAVAPALAEIARSLDDGPLPILAREMAQAVCADRVEFDQHPIARDLIEQLREDRALRFVPYLRPLDELRSSLGLPRGRGAPAGGDFPELAELLERVRAVIRAAPSWEKVTWRYIAEKLGYGERTVRRWLVHHGIDPRALLRAERRARRTK